MTLPVQIHTNPGRGASTMPPLLGDKNADPPTCASRGFEAFARGLSFGLVASTIILDVKGYTAAIRAFLSGSFPEPSKLFPMITQVARRSVGFGVFCGLFTIFQCSLDKWQHNRPINAGISAGLAASASGFPLFYSGSSSQQVPGHQLPCRPLMPPLALRVGGIAITSSILACVFVHMKENMMVEISWGLRDNLAKPDTDTGAEEDGPA